MTATLRSSAPRSTPISRTQHGFTMIELLMVIAILVIVAAMAIPSCMGYLRNYRARNDSNNIVGLISIARMRAGADFARSALSCDSSVTPAVCKIYTLQFNSGGTACTLSTWTKEPQQYKLSAAVTFAIPAGVTNGVGGQSSSTPAQVYAGQTNPYTMYFNSRGWPVDCNGAPKNNYALYLQSQSSFNMAVAVDASGRAQVYLLNGNTYWTIKD